MSWHRHNTLTSLPGEGVRLLPHRTHRWVARSWINSYYNAWTGCEGMLRRAPHSLCRKPHPFAWQRKIFPGIPLVLVWASQVEATRTAQQHWGCFTTQTSLSYENYINAKSWYDIFPLSKQETHLHTLLSQPSLNTLCVWPLRGSAQWHTMASKWVSWMSPTLDTSSYIWL